MISTSTTYTTYLNHYYGCSQNCLTASWHQNRGVIRLGLAVVSQPGTVDLVAPESESDQVRACQPSTDCASAQPDPSKAACQQGLPTLACLLL